MGCIHNPGPFFLFWSLLKYPYYHFKHPPFKTGVVDGVWNLGVMEHFYEPDITRIFQAFDRILKPNGRCIIFWPPVYGLTIMVLAVFLGVVNRFRKQPLALFPDEVSCFRSVRWVQLMLKPAGLHVHKMHFGPRDAFTHVILVVSKSTSTTET